MSQRNMLPRVSTSVFGSIAGVEVIRYDLECSALKASFINYGATMISVQTPDRNGVLENVCINHEVLDDIIDKSPYYGSTIGRVANRISQGEFHVDDTAYFLARNNGPNSLHGGIKGFDKQIWGHKSIYTEEMVGVEFSYISQHMEEGFPGTLHVKATYSLTLKNELYTGFDEIEQIFIINTIKEFEAFLVEKDMATPINLTNHAYWNLSGGLNENISDHELRLFCDHYLPIDSNQIPLGYVYPVENSIFDFRTSKKLKNVLQLIDGGGRPGLDHCFVVNEASLNLLSNVEMRPICILSHPQSGRQIKIYGTQPGVQVYTNNWAGNDPNDHPHVQHGSVAIETQAFPNAINVKEWILQVLLRGDNKYLCCTKHVFSTF